MATTDTTIHHDVGHAHDDHEHDHEQSFLTKYIFSQDHKIIARQFLFTGIAWAFMGGVLSSIIRLQLAWPQETFPFLQPLLGKWMDAGKIDPEFYLGLVTMHGTIMVFFVLTAGLSGTFANFLTADSNLGGRYGVSISEYAFFLGHAGGIHRHPRGHLLFGLGVYGRTNRGLDRLCTA